MINSKDLLKKILLYAFPIIAFMLCLFAEETSLAAKKALYLCLDVVIPSLFPFFVLSGIITPYMSALSCPNILKRIIEKVLKLPYYSIIIILLGFISGYPNGAKMTKDMFNEGLIDSRQATKLLTATNYCSPLFIVGTVGAGLFKSLKLGLFLLLIHWVSGVLSAYITGKIVNYDKGFQPNNLVVPTKSRRSVKQSKPFSVQLTSSIESAAILCVKLTGFITFFAVASELLSQLSVFTFLGKGLSILFDTGSENFSELITAVFKGVIEITSGAQAVSQIKGMQLNMQLAAISLIFGFAGFSAHSQIIGIMNGTGAKYRIFFLAKLLHGVLGCLLTLTTIYLMPMTVETATIGVMPAITWSWGRPIIVLALLASLMAPSFKDNAKSRKSGPY